MVKLYAAVYKNQLLTNANRVIVATEEQWRESGFFEGFTLVEVTVNVLGQVNLEACLEWEIGALEYLELNNGKARNSQKG